jgi:hypothetical protein
MKEVIAPMLAQTAAVPIVEFYLAWLIAVAIGIPAVSVALRNPRRGRILAGAAALVVVALLIHALWANPDWRDAPVSGWNAVGYWFMAILFFIGPCCIFSGVVWWCTRARKAP